MLISRACFVILLGFGSVTFGEMGPPPGWEPNARAKEEARRRASNNNELLFVSRQLYDVFKSMPHDQPNNEVDQLRVQLLQLLPQQSQPLTLGEFSRQAATRGADRAIGMGLNASLPLIRLMYQVVTKQADETSFRDVAEALKKDPTKGSEASLHVLRGVRRTLAEKQAQGKMGFSQGMTHWLANANIRYRLQANASQAGIRVSPVHTILLESETPQDEDPRAKTRTSIQYDVCRDQMGYTWGALSPTGCEFRTSVGVNYGRDISRTRDVYGRYWSWGISVQNKSGGTLARPAQEGRLRLTVPLP